MTAKYFDFHLTRLSSLIILLDIIVQDLVVREIIRT